jgi:hypothetical protein
LRGDEFQSLLQRRRESLQGGLGRISGAPLDAAYVSLPDS